MTPGSSQMPERRGFPACNFGCSIGNRSRLRRSVAVCAIRPPLESLAASPLTQRNRRRRRESPLLFQPWPHAGQAPVSAHPLSHCTDRARCHACSGACAAQKPPGSGRTCRPAPQRPWLPAPSRRGSSTVSFQVSLSPGSQLVIESRELDFQFLVVPSRGASPDEIQKTQSLDCSSRQNRHLI
jgi:hypothetical protein